MTEHTETRYDLITELRSAFYVEGLDWEMQADGDDAAFINNIDPDAPTVQMDAANWRGVEVRDLGDEWHVILSHLPEGAELAESIDSTVVDTRSEAIDAAVRFAHEADDVLNPKQYAMVTVACPLCGASSSDLEGYDGGPSGVDGHLWHASCAGCSANVTVQYRAVDVTALRDPELAAQKGVETDREDECISGVECGTIDVNYYDYGGECSGDHAKPGSDVEARQ